MMWPEFRDPHHLEESQSILGQRLEGANGDQDQALR